MAESAARLGHDSASHGRADGPASPRVRARRRALVRRRRTAAVAGVTVAFAVLAGLPWSQALQAASLEGPSTARALAESTGPPASDEPVGTTASAGAASSASSASSAGASSSARVVVAEDDTIWNLARAHAPSGTHPAVYAREVMELNDVDPRRLRAGEVLSLPVR